MSLVNKANTVLTACANTVRFPLETIRAVAGLSTRQRARDFARAYSNAKSSASSPATQRDDPSSLRRYFDDVQSGPGVWKWLHYLDAMETHLARFVGTEVTLAEVGIYSGGSLPMWRHFLGERCHIHGIDIESACNAYANEYTTVHIGDQADRGFWARFRAAAPKVDILVDDGGHDPQQQIVTLEEMLPHLSCGGIYVCEDIHGISNRFAVYASTLASELNSYELIASPTETASLATPFQQMIHSIHFYPYLLVIEKRARPIDRLAAPRRGSEWQPFSLR